jgi:hypothetical protein
MEDAIKCTRGNAGALGRGWTLDTSDGHLRFKFDGEQRMVLHNKSGDYRVWTAEHGDLRERMFHYAYPLGSDSDVELNKEGIFHNFTETVYFTSYKGDICRRLQSEATWANFKTQDKADAQAMYFERKP